MNGSGFTETPTESPTSKTLSSYIQRLDRFPEMHREGKVLQVIGHMVEATNPGCSVGGMCTIYNPADDSRACLLYTSPSPRDLSTSRMPSSA